jgi:peptidoglycan/LPS O-acetylase OafA/YrhL
MSRKPALDGLRALAVVAVMAFHTSPAAHGGFLGVDVFFVISGYLITALLLREWSRTGGIDLRSFYLRRALRLGPALLLMLVVTIPLIFTVLRSSMGINPFLAIASVLLYVANWANVAVDVGTGPLTHTWSLSIEEQFYLIWPIVLVLVLSRRRKPPASALAVLIAVVVVARWICWDTTHGDWIYYATTSHCDGLLLGSLLAIGLDRRPAGAAVPRGSEAAAWLGLAGLAAFMAGSQIGGGATYEYGLFAVAVCAALVVQHLAVAESGLLVRILSVRPLVAVGTVSYGLYLFHFPVFQAVQHQGYPHLIQHSLEISISVALTVFSWFVVEKPALRLKDHIFRPGSSSDLSPVSPGSSASSVSSVRATDYPSTLPDTVPRGLPVVTPEPVFDNGD